MYIERICASRPSVLREPAGLTATMQLNRYLMDVYEPLQNSCDIKFPHIPEKMFITLAIIEKQSVSRANADPFTKGTFHGHADEILKKKKPITIEEIFEPSKHKESVKLVFVEGAPGIGKSTFALELCKRQEFGKFSFKLVVLLRLRERRVQGMKDVRDLFYQNGDLQQEVTDEVRACKGKNVLLVLDGFDELPIELRKDSFIVELIQGKHLRECTLVVTSRPSATYHLQSVISDDRIDKRIEVLGFTQERITQYAKSMLSDQPDNMCEDFLKYISVNPAIYGMMYIPLNSAIIVKIYKTNKSDGKLVPRTMTQLYTELCLVLMKKFLKEKDESLVADQLTKLEQLPQTFKIPLLKLGKLALEGTLENKISFEQLPDGCSDLGFMNVTTELYLGSKTVVSYSFLHLTLQEFLAAFYVSQQKGVEQKLVFIENLMLSKLESSHMDVMWRFMAGLTQFNHVGWNLVYKAARRISGGNLSCRPLLIRCLFEVHNEQRVQAICDSVSKIWNKEKVEMLLSTPFDCFAAGYCAASSTCNWYFNFISDGGDEVLEMFSCGLNSVASRCSESKLGLKFRYGSLTQHGIAYFNTIPCVLKQISELNFSGNALIGVDALKHLANALSSMISLTSLNLSDNTGGDDGMKVVFYQLPLSIEELIVNDTYFGVSSVTALSQHLETTKNLKKMKIGDLGMSTECIELLMKTVFSKTSLTHVEFWSIKFNYLAYTCFEPLENNSNLISLEFVYCVGVFFAFPYVARALHCNTSLKILGMPSVQIEEYDDDEGEVIGDDEVEALSRLLETNKTLTTVKVYTYEGLSLDNVQTLNEALKCNENLQSLKLSNLGSWDARITFNSNFDLD